MAGSEHTDNALHSQLSTDPPPPPLSPSLPLPSGGGEGGGEGDIVAAGWWRVRRNKSVCVCLICQKNEKGALELLCAVLVSAFSPVPPSCARRASAAFRVSP